MKSSSHTLVAYLRSLVARQGIAEDDDGELLRRFLQTRDEDAFAALMRRHGPMVLNLARRIGGDEQLAEDVFQATFLLLSQKAHTIRRPESLSCWLHGVAHRLAVQARRSRLRRRRQEAQIRPTAPSTPLDELTAQEFLTVLDEELRRLPENQRAPLILCCLEGLSQEEAAKRLGCSSDAIKGRLERGRNRLRLRLEKRGLTLPAVLGATLLTAGAVKALPPLLLQSTLHAATTGIGATPAVVALIQETMRMMFLHKLKWVGTAVLLFVLGGAGVGTMALRPQAAKESAPSLAAADDKPLSADKRVDLYGDPLPDGAVMRLGTLQRRAVGAQIAVTADGKSVVSVRGGRYVCIWDATTGQLRQRSELPVDSFLSMGQTELSPNGCWLAEQRPSSDTTLTIWEVRTGKKMCDLILKDTGKLHSCAFSTDGRRFASVGSLGKDSLVRIWNVSDGKRIFDQRILANSCESLIFTPDGKYLLASLNCAPSD